MNYNNDNDSKNDNNTKNADNDYYKDVEPLPESSRPRHDGPGGE